MLHEKLKDKSCFLVKALIKKRVSRIEDCLATLALDRDCTITSFNLIVFVLSLVSFLRRVVSLVLFCCLFWDILYLLTSLKSDYSYLVQIESRLLESHQNA